MLTSRSNSKERGFTLLSMSLWAVILFGCLGLSVDVGRLFINKNEAQMYVDSAAMAAATRLNGTSAGLQAARDMVNQSANQWDFGTRTFGTTTVDFATAANPQTWVAGPNPATGYTRVRVSTSITQRQFFRSLFSHPTQLVRSQATAEQAPQGKFNQGRFRLRRLRSARQDLISA
ncbi:MAG: hypothetical protein HY235_14740 [Acidobacteria bacterium]|nr:hypothetical protein [Acidobacteriota bacterium]